ncbi:hypothetical protein ASE99_01745 [Serratia sp. Leaf51]|nr:hypothetical protein ASE99_01745 [Serratia sp. Leaf51]
MAWYKTGTVAVAATKVTGTGTNFLDAKFGVGPGQAFLLPASGTVKIYEIASVEDATHLTLTTSAGTVAAGAAYAVMSFYTDSIPDFSKRLAAQLGYYQSQMDGWQTIMTGTGAVSVTAPDGTVVNISSFAKLTSDIAKAYTDGGLLNATVTPNSLGNVTDFNIYYQTANTNAIVANGYPIAKAGTLYVTKSAYGCQQMYITFQGEAFLRGLTGAFTPAAPNWSDWWPIFTGKSTVPVANGGTGATTAATAINNLGGLSKTTGGIVTGGITANGGLAVALTSGFNLVGAGGGAGNDITAASGSGSTPNTGFVGAWQYKWYADAWLAGITRGPGTDTRSYGIYYNGGSGTSRLWEFKIDGTAVGAGAWTNGSDERHKSNILVVRNPLAAVCSWRGATYNVLDGGKSVGLIAQEVEPWCPEAVKAYGDRTFSDGTVVKDFKYLDTPGVSAAFHNEAIKELFKLVELALDDPEECRAQIASIKQVMVKATQEPTT